MDSISSPKTNLFKAISVGDESKADGRASILKSWGLWGLMILVVCGGIFGTYGVKKFFSLDKPKPEIPVQYQAAAPANPKPFKPASNASASVYKDIMPSANEVRLSALWRVAGYVRAPVKRSQTTSQMLGVDHVDLTERVALVNGSHYRYVPFSQCQFFDGGIDIYCDIDGERVTPWSGGGAVTSVYQPDHQQQAQNQMPRPL